MTHNQNATTTVQVQMTGRTILDCIMRKLPSSRKYYRVTLIVPDNGIPIIEYHQASTSKKPKKSIQFADLLFADKKHDTNEKFALSIYTIDKTTTFLAQDETTMNEWLSKIRECHSNLFPEFKRYDSIFEATLLDKGLAKTMNLQGPYRLALSKDSLDLIPVLTAPHLLEQQLQQVSTICAGSISKTQQSLNEIKLPGSHHLLSSSILTSTNAGSPHTNHHHAPQHLPNHQRFHKRHPLLSSKTIELVLRSIRRCGHTDCNFYIESGRHAQIGEGHLWMALNKKSTARHLHELLLATMKLASTVEDQFPYKAPRSRSGSSSENAMKAQQARSSSLMCLVSDPNGPNLSTATPNTCNYISNPIQAVMASFPMPNTSTLSTTPLLSNNNNPSTNNNNNIDEDSGYLPMA